MGSSDPRFCAPCLGETGFSIFEPKIFCWSKEKDNILKFD